jgi:glycosyltransferase involved in cell wall biosynthesis
MTIAYLIDYDPGINCGVMQKIRQQSSRWRTKGHTVYLVSTKTMAVYSSEEKILYRQKPLNIELGKIGTALNLLYNAYHIASLMKQIDIDMVYMRYRPYMPFFQKMLKQYKVIMEINSDDTVEYKTHSKLKHWYNRYTREIFLKDMDAFVSVSYELKEHFLYLNKPIEVIANGIDVRGCDMAEGVENKHPTLVFVGSPGQSWHGMEKIIKMAEHFKVYRFYIIGTKGEETDNIRYFGYLSQEEAMDVIKECDVGIGTLSLYQAGLQEASPLKTRQYLACGLPLIYAYKDTDLDEEAAFALKLENAEHNMDYSKIEQFVQKVYKNRDIKNAARDFAKDVLDYAKTEERRLDFFQKVLDA